MYGISFMYTTLCQSEHKESSLKLTPFYREQLKNMLMNYYLLMFFSLWISTNFKVQQMLSQVCDFHSEVALSSYQK